MDSQALSLELTDLDPAVRRHALQKLAQALESGEIQLGDAGQLLNLHCHTCYSYNAYGHTPTSLAWLAREQGWHALATVDFDVLDAVTETLDACDTLGVRGGAGLETRVFVPEFADREMNSPGEPGICYFVGVGFTSPQAPTQAQTVLDEMRRSAARRNREMTTRINAFTAPVTVDYDRDVLPQTPSGNATERHMLVAYDAAARKVYPKRSDMLAFWTEKLKTDVATVDAALGNAPSPNELLRAKLMKHGGVGYVQPDGESFPRLAEVSAMITACGALPTYAWLDGTSAGEQAIEGLLQVMLAQGVVGLTAIPERNWNYSDAAKRAKYATNLDAIMALAAAYDLPVFIGTEMNKAGQPLVDDIVGVPELVAHREAFTAGADILYGHTVLQRALGQGYTSAWAVGQLPKRAARNAFFRQVGRLVAPGQSVIERLHAELRGLSSVEILAHLGA
ncbi:MAG: hypothetical protein GXY52_02995 [Chloroflexi bacterium]|nr:hypothetical protein [Chloroflexota bacterium]